MNEKALPTKHLSARVPWHDNKWNGTCCNNPMDNSFCRILPRIDSSKLIDWEITNQNKKIDDNMLPPCAVEKGAFLSPHGFIRKAEHAWNGINPLYESFLPAYVQHKPFSFSAVPFLWMMKTNAKDDNPHYSAMADLYSLEYDAKLECQIDKQLGFEGNKWVQHPNNQKTLLNGFFGCLKPDASLVFFYSKHTPLSEPNQRVIIGVAKIRSIGEIIEYNYPMNYNGHRGYVWDRIIGHTLTDKERDGFILPYHEIIDFQKENDSDINLQDFVVIAPDYWQFSYASELVEHDTAIDSLFAMAEQLKKSEKLLEKSFERELNWIDTEVSKLWDMRGAFPGMGPVLSALEIYEGNTIAWEIEKYINQKDGDLLKTNPWEIFEKSLLNPQKYLGKIGEKLFSSTTKKLWQLTPSKKMEFVKLISRLQLNNDQANFILNHYKNFVKVISEYLNNPYLLYEKFKFEAFPISFNQVDKALFPAEKILSAFPLPATSSMEDSLDLRRLRALCISILEQAAEEGHSLLPFNELLERILNKKMETSLPIRDDVLISFLSDQFMRQELNIIPEDFDENIDFVKLKRLQTLKDVISSRLDINDILNDTYKIKKDWLKLVNSDLEFVKLDAVNIPDKDEILARKEKAEALKVLCNYKFSVLIGPAGSGKTKLLGIFENISEIRSGHILKLAPTGKARVKLGHDAKTVAQYLYPERYNIQTRRYFCAPNESKDNSSATVIIDEASMLTEDQLAAIFDKLGAVDRIILVGDYRQLPPIGTGKPFVDIINRIKPAKFKGDISVGPAYSELKQIRRQISKGKRGSSGKQERADIILSRCFSDEIEKYDLDQFRDIASGKVNNDFIRLEKWYDSKDFKELFSKILIEELELSAEEPEKDFNRRIGAVDSGGYQYFNYADSPKFVEKWQIITPVNGYSYGVKEINKFIQYTYRKGFIDLAINAAPRGNTYPNPRRIAKPKGSDNIVYGDKVINLNNTVWFDNQWITPREMKPKALNYIANGEIGIVTGIFKTKKMIERDKELKQNSKGAFKEPNIEIAFSTQPGYSYVYWPSDLNEDGNYNLELAYAITIHKAQGSGFEKVFLVLPSRGQILSRELLYTALTRQEKKVIILHQGEFREFLKYASPLASSTARRFTDLFFLPSIKEFDKKYYDINYTNISERGERMISKSEVIIANCLNKYKDKLTYAYEEKLKLDSYEKAIKPDFTIKNLKTKATYYWEHLGMMTMERYRDDWNKKLKSYKKDGFVFFDKANPTDKKILIVTEDNINGGVDSQYFDQIVKRYILGEN